MLIIAIITFIIDVSILHSHVTVAEYNRQRYAATAAKMFLFILRQRRLCCRCHADVMTRYTLFYTICRSACRYAPADTRHAYYAARYVWRAFTPDI